jgi:hypothetical protein
VAATVSFRRAIMSKSLRVLFAAAVVLTLVVGFFSIFTEVEAKGPCRCPLVYAPVECDRGKVYPNQCVADCRHAKNCFPIGVL